MAYKIPENKKSDNFLTPQTFEIYLKDIKDKRITKPELNSTVAIYTWQFDNKNLNKITKHFESKLRLLCKKYLVAKFVKELPLQIRKHRWHKTTYVNAPEILDYLEFMNNDNEKIHARILLTSNLIASQPNTICNGLARCRTKVACISTNNQNDDVLLNTIIHEFGHILGLRHCHNLECVMVKGKEINKNQRNVCKINDNFCSECLEKINYLLK